MAQKQKWKITGGLAIGFLFSTAAVAQLQSPVDDPLARMRAVAAQSEVCAADEPSACARAAPRIVAAAENSPFLVENARRLHAASAADMARIASVALAALRDATDQVHSEQANVVGEIRGREHPEEFVLLGAFLGRESSTGFADDYCNAALVIEAARAVRMSGLRPRRSIRFVLFGDALSRTPGPLAYIRAHRAELDRVAAAAIFDGGCSRVTGFSLGGRPGIESGLREAFSVAPVNSWDIQHNTSDAPLSPGTIDFLLEGVVTLRPNREAGNRPQSPEADLRILRQNAAVAGILGLALAERLTPLGSRFSRDAVAMLLKSTGLDSRMKADRLWSQWESAQRGREP